MTARIAHLGSFVLYAGFLVGVLLGFGNPSAAFAQTTSFVMTADPGASIGGGTSYAFTPSDGTFTATSFAAEATAGQRVLIRFNTPD